VGRHSLATCAYSLGRYTRPMVEPQEIEKLLRAAFPDATVLELEDLTGSKDHYQATIVSAAFVGLSRVAQHQAVYRALGDLMKGPIHALALNTFSPDAYAKKRIG
jgi:stress-induced morphogen